MRGTKEGETRSGMHVLRSGKWVGVIPLSCRWYSGTCPVGSLCTLSARHARGAIQRPRLVRGGAGAVSVRCVLGDWEGKDRVGAAVFEAWR